MAISFFTNHPSILSNLPSEIPVVEWEIQQDLEDCRTELDESSRKFRLKLTAKNICLKDIKLKHGGQEFTFHDLLVEFAHITISVVPKVNEDLQYVFYDRKESV